MALMERVAMLLRANVNDMIDRAEDPEKMLKLLLLDMENQLLQVKTQVAIAIADQHVLARKQKDQQDGAAGWRAKAELAVRKSEDELARLALDRALSHDEMARGFAAQLTEQAAETESLRATYHRLQGKLRETAAQCEMLVAEHRRARTAAKATRAMQSTEKTPRGSVLGRFQAKVRSAEATTHADRALLEGATLEERFAKIERSGEVERLLKELKLKNGRMLEAG